ncbi:MAG: glycosyltransferase family 9 protein, partial [Planctomycetes bacterium]|nr:glycosyltransferase family 9 protein [Planctomycetota bacterium]
RWGHHRSEVKEHAWLLPGVSPDRPAGHVHRVEKNLHLVRALGYRGPVPQSRLPDRSAERHRLRQALALNDSRALIVLHPFVSPFGRFKEWPAERFVRLARRLVERRHRVVVTWTAAERATSESIVERVGDGCELAPETSSLKELAALLELAATVVAADTGPLHLAAAVDTPVIGLFGPKDPVRYGPYSARSRVVRSGAPCSPCTLRRCEHAICMQTLAVDDVLIAIREV